jgi:phage-related protein (TIGR01555 family)
MNAHVSMPSSMIYDTFLNLLTSIGVAGKDRVLTQSYAVNYLTPDQLEMAYRGDWIARKCIDVPAQDSTRAWRQWQAEKDDITKIEKLEKDLCIPLKLQNALKKARLYGGGALILGVNKGSPEDELDYTKVGKDQLKFVHAVSRWEIGTGPRITDVMSPWYGQPEYYERQPLGGTVLTKEAEALVGLRIHPSRVIQLIGSEYPNMQTAPDVWGDSSLQVIDDAIRSVATVSSSLAQLITDAKLDIISVPNLTEITATKAGEAKLTKRFSYANAHKSIINSVLLDKEEEWDRVTVNFSGMPEILQMYLLIAAGAADIPVTRLLGQAPAGMNATGESDIRNYYDRLNSDQKMRLTPAVTPLDEVLIRSALGSRDEAIHYEWNSLWQLDEVQKAALAKSKADTYKIDSDAALIPADILREARVNQLIEDGTYPGLETIIEDWEAENGDMSEAPDQLLPPPLPANSNDPNAPPNPANANGPQPAPQPAPGDPQGTPAPKKAAATGDDYSAMPPYNRKRRKRITSDARPRGLYVYRKVQNAQDIVDWARKEGFESMLPKGELHVTIAYCRTPIDWTKIRETGSWGSNQEDGTLRIAPGGMRLVDTLGDQGAVVLFFASAALCWRHEDIGYCGAEYDYPDYQPHITISYNQDSAPDLRTVTAYQGPIVLGPEVFEEIKPTDNYTPDPNGETAL